MGKVSGFLEYERLIAPRRLVEKRLQDFREFEGDLDSEELQRQGARCMDCGVPFCQSGCPLGNIIPAWNDATYRNQWDSAISLLHQTNNFPEVTGRICPAPCESACVAGLHDEPITIKQIEREISKKLSNHNGLSPVIAEKLTGHQVAIIGSGPAGMACAQQLARAGHRVTVFERDDRVGGLLRYGIPDFKMEKSLIDARVEQMEAEGVTFRCGVEVGKDISYTELRDRYDAVVIAIGATKARSLPIAGHELEGVHLAMDFLTQQNRRIAGEEPENPISAKGKHVIILGGGDTGSDCLGTSLRQGAASVLQVELMPKPPMARADHTPWPHWPHIFRTSSSQEEGGDRSWALLTERFIGEDGRLTGLEVVNVIWDENEEGRWVMTKLPDTRRTIKADLCFLALGFTGPESGSLQSQLQINLAASGTVEATEEEFVTNDQGVFACGDARRGQSLVVWAIWEGRETAHRVDTYLRGEPSHLPTSPANVA